jgi:hypothetical protein
LEAFDNRGINPESVSALTQQLMYATKVKAQFYKGSPAVIGEDGEVLVEAEPPGFRYSKPLADNTTQYNVLRLVMEFFDTMPSKKIDINDERQTRNFVNQVMMKLSQEGKHGTADDHPQLTEVEEELLAAGSGTVVEMKKFTPVPMIPTDYPLDGTE